MVDKNIQNETTIQEYSRFRLKAEKISENSVITQQFYLRNFSRALNKSFKDATENDIINFLDDYKDSTRDTIIATLRKFYKWLYKLDNGDRLPAYIRNIKPTPLRIRRKGKEIVYREREITEDEYQRLTDNVKTPMHKAMLETLYIFGVRVGELLSMNSNDVIYDGEFTKITVRESKTIARDVPYNGRADHLMAYVESYQPFKGQPDKPLWVGRDNVRFSKRGMLNLINRTTKYAGINRKINNHDFRHTSISRDLRNGVPVTHIETKHGLTHGSQVIKIYDHNKTKNYEEWLNKKKKETPETYQTLKRKSDEISELKKQLDEVRSMFKKAVDINQHPEYYWTEEEHREYERRIEEKDRIIKEKITVQEAEERAKMTLEEIKKERQLFLQAIEEAKRNRGENVIIKPKKLAKPQRDMKII